EDVAVRTLAADLVGVHAGGLGAVVAVGDEELAPRHRLAHRLERRWIVDPPEPVHGAVVVGRLAERLGLRVRLERLPRAPAGVVVEAEDRAQVRVRRAGEAEAVLPRAGVRALVRADLARAVLGHAHAREDPAARERAAVGAGVVLD